MMEPDREYDLWCHEREQRYKALIEGKTCLGCGKAFEDDDGFMRCLEWGEIIDEGDTPGNLDCEDYEE